MSARSVALYAVILLLTLLGAAQQVRAGPARWQEEWPRTDFSRHTVSYDEILSGGPPKDAIPAIDRPTFISVQQVRDLAKTEPVIGFAINGDARAYPLRVLVWHEIANDTVGGVPIAVTYCPLCNSAIVFERVVDGRELDFGTTGKLRNSDLVMYDRQTESWWQQFTGEAIVGSMTGATLKMLPARLESFNRFASRFPAGKVMVPADPRLRSYGTNPYRGYDQSARPFLYRGEYPEGIAPLARVVAVEDEAWSLDLLRRKGRIESHDLVITWEPGQNSALDAELIPEGWDVGNVTVLSKTADGWADARYDVTFAFVFHTFHPKGRLHVQ
jgi:hypothetical protein